MGAPRRRAAPGLAPGVREAYLDALGAGGALRDRRLDVLAHAHDASHVLLTPSAVVVPPDAEAVARLFRAADRTGTSLTFRSGGTSLSGQAGTSGVLVDVRSRFREVEVLDGGLRVRVGPGATVRQVNARLARHGRRLGPDPASEVACTVGGMIANNASGMTCGTTANSYATLDSLVLVLPSGTVLDTSAPGADGLLRAREPELHAGLARLRDLVRSRPDLRARVEAQFSMKNTMGYGLNSLLDHDDPVDVLAHLVVGSEGTLAFIASAVLRTVPLLPHARTGLLVLDDLASATGALPDLLETAPAAVELLDATSLRVAQRDPRGAAALGHVRVQQQAALLVEYQAGTAEEVEEAAGRARPVLVRLSPHPVDLSADAATRADLWHVRKGLYAAVAGARPTGTTALLEDVVVPVPRLLPTCEALTAMFTRFGYADSVVFGHAKDGNVHFMLTERLDGSRTALDRFSAFTEDLVELVLGQGGSLKAEHGTGRVMAPFVRRQYGDELHAVMRELKRLCDPAGLLAPGVLLSDDADLHLRDLKTAPPVEAEVDTCVECGFCEPVCPSRDLTTTPRQRIALRREVARAQRDGQHGLARELEEDGTYDVVQTCAVDGMCQTACPVGINTGDLVKRLRRGAHGPVARAGWTAAAEHWGTATRAAGAALTAASLAPAPAVRGANHLARSVLGPEAVPLWSPELPRGGRAPRRAGAGAAGPGAGAPEAVLFSSCTGALFGPATPGALGAGEALRVLCERAGVPVADVAGSAAWCCGTPWRSKGLTGGAQVMAQRVLPELWEATGHGRLPVVVDASSCSEGLRQAVADGPLEHRGLLVVDAVDFCAERLLPSLEVTAPVRDAAVHPTCSAVRDGSAGALLALASAVAGRAFVPDSWGCCAFAGDRGLLHPELTASATAAQAREVAAAGAEAHVSCNRTCELGMTRATGSAYEHVLELVERATRPAPS